MCSTKLTVDDIIDTLILNKDKLAEALTEAKEGVDVNLTFSVSKPLPAVSGGGSSGVASLSNSWSVKCTVDKKGLVNVSSESQ